MPNSICDILTEEEFECIDSKQHCNHIGGTFDQLCYDRVLLQRLNQLRDNKIVVLNKLISGKSSETPVNIEPGYHIYGLPQTIYKISPTYDMVILKLLVADPVSLIMIPAPKTSAWVESLTDRLEALLNRDFPEYPKQLLDRIMFIRSLNETEYMTFCAVVDVILDPFPIGGGRSSFEIFSTGNVIVLQESLTSILHLTSGMYKAMGFDAQDCCIADNSDQYVEKSIKIAANETYRRNLRTEIFSRKNMLYENSSVLEEWENLLRAIISSPRPIPTGIRGQNDSATARCTSLSNEHDLSPNEIIGKLCPDVLIAPENLVHDDIFNRHSYPCIPISMELEVFIF